MIDLKALLSHSKNLKKKLKKMQINQKLINNHKIKSWRLNKSHFYNKEKMKKWIKGKKTPSMSYLLRDLFLKVTIYIPIKDNL